MGEMTIRIDDALLVELSRAAEQNGAEPSDLAVRFIVHGLQNRDLVAHGRSSGDISTGRRAVLGSLREIRSLQSNVSPYDSVDLLREDRDR